MSIRAVPAARHRADTYPSWQLPASQPARLLFRAAGDVERRWGLKSLSLLWPSPAVGHLPCVVVPWFVWCWKGLELGIRMHARWRSARTTHQFDSTRRTR